MFTRLRRCRAPAFFTLLALSTALLLVRVEQGAPPFEDAAILMRYSLNLARGLGIVWNAGEPPVDGATDFLFMVSVAAIVRLGVPLELATRSLIAASHLALVFLVYHYAPALGVRSVVVRLAAPLYIAAGPAAVLMSAYFGAPVFALLVGTSAFLALDLTQHFSERKSLAFSCSVALASLTRPEGAIVGLFLFAMALYLIDHPLRRRLATTFLAINLAVGMAYVGWRWAYFGHVLPNPLYKKGGLFYMDSLKVAVRSSWDLFAPWVPVWLASLVVFWRREYLGYWKRILAVALPGILFVSLWLFISNETNNFYRYQYPALPLGLIPSMIVADELMQWTSARLNGLVAGVARWSLALYLLLACTAWMLHASNIPLHRDGRYDVATRLHRLAKKGYTMAVTEAGLLPLYSDWRAIDCWGLNDHAIALKGYIRYRDLVRLQPDLVMIHTGFDPTTRLPNSAGEWGEMVAEMYRYCVTHDYELAAAYGARASDLHLYFVKKGLPDTERIVDAIRGVEYAWYETGQPASDFRELIESGLR